MVEQDIHQQEIQKAAFCLSQNGLNRVVKGTDPYTKEMMQARPEQLNKDYWEIAKSLVETYGPIKALQLIYMDSAKDRLPR